MTDERKMRVPSRTYLSDSAAHKIADWRLHNTEDKPKTLDDEVEFAKTHGSKTIKAVEKALDTINISADHSSKS